MYMHTYVYVPNIPNLGAQKRHHYEARVKDILSHPPTCRRGTLFQPVVRCEKERKPECSRIQFYIYIYIYYLVSYVCIWHVHDTAL